MRRDGDSNPGTALDGYTLSRRASSATRASLHRLRLQSYKLFTIRHLLFTIFLLFQFFNSSILQFFITSEHNNSMFILSDGSIELRHSQNHSPCGMVKVKSFIFFSEGQFFCFSILQFKDICYLCRVIKLVYVFHRNYYCSMHISDNRYLASYCHQDRVLLGHGTILNSECFTIGISDAL